MKELLELNPIIGAIIEGNNYKVDDTASLSKELDVLANEEVAIETGEYSSNFAPLFEYLDSDSFDMALSGEKASIYDRLMDIWEESQDAEVTEKGE